MNDSVTSRAQARRCAPHEPSLSLAQLSLHTFGYAAPQCAARRSRKSPADQPRNPRIECLPPLPAARRAAQRMNATGRWHKRTGSRGVFHRYLSLPGTTHVAYQTSSQTGLLAH